MKVIAVRNVHRALPEGMYQLHTHGINRESRYGDVIVIDGPVTTLYERPTERVMFHPKRDCNPFFHFMEGLWMLAGRRDVAWLSQFSSKISEFSDDGDFFHGAYGYRWREHFDMDQLDEIINTLQTDPNSRRCVVGMWDPNADLQRKHGKDLPCNTHIYFSRNHMGALDMTVCNRSNDMIWGAYGANAVHFSMLQEYVACAIGCEVGRYWQMSNNFHAYVEVYDKHTSVMNDGIQPRSDPYSEGEVEPYLMMRTNAHRWMQDLHMFMDVGPLAGGMTDPFWRRVVVPIWTAWFTYLAKDNSNRFTDAITILERCEASDWRKACIEWIERREDAFINKQAAKKPDDEEAV